MRFIIFITTLLAFVWSCYWFIMSNKYSNKVFLWSDIGSSNVSASLSKIRGFPNRFDTTITDLEIKQASFEPIKIERLDVMRLSYDSSHYIFAAKSVQNIFGNNFTFSKGLVSAVSNGELGFQTPDLYVPEFKHQIESLPVGQLSQPFETVHGWHIVEVLERRQVDRTDSAMTNKAYRILFNRKFNEEVGAWMQEIRAGAYVEILGDENDS